MVNVFLSCPCGAKTPRVGIIKQRAKSPDGPYTVGCTCCGHVGYHDRTQTGAVENWEAERYLYGPVHD